jgi:hypothetical protein
MESDRKVEAVVRVCERDEMFLIEEREREREREMLIIWILQSEITYGLQIKCIVYGLQNNIQFS